MTRIFCDANVLFAAAISPDGRSAALFDLGAARGVDLIASSHVINEARTNLMVRYPNSMERFEREILSRVVVVGEAPAAAVAWASTQGLPDSDAPVLAAAVAGGADVLVTGDRKHFAQLFGRKLRGVSVLTLRATLDLLLLKS